MDMYILDEMDLPLSNPKEELESISNNHFKPLFDVTSFEIRKEIERDKGIDFDIEIKKNGKYTNFRFTIQLKATESKKKNQDGSISLQIETSNINYLFNGGRLAYYVLYNKPENSFYFESLNQFAKELSDADQEWYKQHTHVLRFSKRLNIDQINKIYNSTLDRGIFQRTINEKLAIQSSFIDLNDKIVVDANSQVISDKEIREQIESVGLELINQFRWKEILLIHSKATSAVASTAKYNLIIGMAYYYSSEHLKALIHFQQALKSSPGLTGILFEHLRLLHLTTRYSIGLIKSEEYSIKSKEFESTSLGAYIKIELAKARYLESPEIYRSDRYENFVKNIDEIISSSLSNENVKLIARCEAVLIEGSKLNMDYVSTVANIRAMETKFDLNVSRRVEAGLQVANQRINWHNKVRLLKEDCLQNKNQFAFNNAQLNEIKVMYEFEVYASLVNVENIDKLYESDKRIQQLLEQLHSVMAFYEQIGHIENLCVALSLKYELEHYANKTDESLSTIDRLSEYVDNYNLAEFKLKSDELKNRGTTHERLKQMLDSLAEQGKADEKEYDAIVKEMKKLDENDRQRFVGNNMVEVIHLFPIGYFQYPMEKRRDVFKIISISDDIRSAFDLMYDEYKVIPIANIYHNPVKQEGYGDDKFADKGIESWRNIYQIRKALFENGFKKFEPPN
jgi:hypothetical protein